MKSKVIIQIMIKNKLKETGQQCFEINFLSLKYKNYRFKLIKLQLLLTQPVLQSNDRLNDRIFQLIRSNTKYSLAFKINKTAKITSFSSNAKNTSEQVLKIFNVITVQMPENCKLITERLI